MGIFNSLEQQVQCYLKKEEQLMQQRIEEFKRQQQQKFLALQSAAYRERKILWHKICRASNHSEDRRLSIVLAPDRVKNEEIGNTGNSDKRSQLHFNQESKVTLFLSLPVLLENTFHHLFLVIVMHIPHSIFWPHSMYNRRFHILS